MSFRGDDQRRYGHIPPVQYPVANDQQQQQQQQNVPGRRLSFNSGDDSAPFSPGGTRQSYQQQQPTVNTRGLAHGDELFLATEAARGNYGSTNSAMSGYQHQYSAQTPPTPSAYNPQNFVGRPNAPGLPYSPHPSGNRFGAQSAGPYSPTSATTNFTPAPYNPAAYSSTSASVPPSRQSMYDGSGYGRPSSQGYSPTPAMNPSNYWQSQPTYSSPPSQSGGMPSPPAPFPAYDQPSPGHAPLASPGHAPLGSPGHAPLGSPGHAPLASPGHAPQASPGLSPQDAIYSQYSQHTYATEATTPPAVPYPTTSSQAPYPTYSDIPTGPNYSSADPHSFLNRTSRSSSQASPLPSPPMQPPASSPGLQRHPTNAPLPSRPIAEDPWDNNGNDNEVLTQDSIIKDIEAELNAGGGSQSRRPHAFDQRNGGVGDNDLNNLRRLTSSASYHSTATTVNTQDDGSGVNRYSSNASTLNRNHSQNPYSHPEEDGDESDPEAAAGLLAMQQADEDDRSRLSMAVSFPYFSQPEVSVQPAMHSLPEEPSSDSDYAAMDLGLFSGGYAGNMAYDKNMASPPGTEIYQPDGQSLTPRSNHASQRSHGSGNLPAFEQVEVDYGGTGGLQAPTGHRLSFDEGDEPDSLQSRQSGSDSPHKEDYPDMFYHPGLSNRPLPAIPPANSDSSSMLSVQSPSRGTNPQGYSFSADTRPYSGPDANYGQNAHQLQLERAISLSGHSTSPQVQMPMRSRTDAEDRKKAAALSRQPQQSPPYEGYDTGTASSINYDVITLPSGRRRKFIPEKLTLVDTRTCEEPWSLSGISNWLREMAEGEPDLKRKTVEDGLVRLFCLKVPTMNVAVAEGLGSTVVDSMMAAGILVPEEEWLKFGPGMITGVLWQLTGSGCYAPKLHEIDDDVIGHEVPTRCYSYHCGRTLKKANLDGLNSDGVKKVDWATYYGLKMEDMEGKHKKEIERQNNLHEVITSEEEYMDQLDVLGILYRDQLTHAQPRIIAENRLEKFVSAVFGKAEAIQQINMDHLLAQMKYRQKEQGPWILGFSDLFREWIRKAKVAYIEYASAFPYATYLVRKEAERNYMFKQFLEKNRAHPRSKRLDWSTFLKSPITRLQRYNLLLGVSMKNMLGDSEEKSNLIKAMEEIKQVALEADAKVDEMQKKVTMIELDQMLVLRPGFHADLNLDHLGRELIIHGDLQRMGSKGVRWVDTHALLFDHYLILSKLVTSKDGRQDKKYDVSKEVSNTLIYGILQHVLTKTAYSHAAALPREQSR